MQFLSEYGLASVPAMRVLHRYLDRGGKAMTADELRSDLQPVSPRGEEESRDKRRDVVASSLRIGKYLRLFSVEPASRPERWRALALPEREELPDCDAATDARMFASIVLRRLGSRAVAAASGGEDAGDVPDLALGLTALSLRDPVTPFLYQWDDTDTPFGHRDLAGVNNREQWRFFRRWAMSLGLANHIPGKPEFLAADPSRAIADVLHLMGARASAASWFRHLYEILPTLGAAPLVARFAGPAPTSAVSGSVALAVRKLAKRRRLELTPLDDSSEQVNLTLGGVVRRVGEMRVLKEAT